MQKNFFHSSEKIFQLDGKFTKDMGYNITAEISKILGILKEIANL